MATQAPMGALLYSWTCDVRNREWKGMEVLQNGLEFWNKAKAQGDVRQIRYYVNMVGRAGGYFIVEGQTDRLAALHFSEEGQALSTAASLVVEGYEVFIAGGGDPEEIGELVQSYEAALQSVVGPPPGNY